MGTQVKVNHGPESAENAGFLAVFWLIYFLLTIAVVGWILAFGIVFPLYLSGYFFPRSRRLADQVMCGGIRFLLRIQPWLNVKIEMPTSAIPDGCLLVSNHRSHLDSFLLLSSIPGIKFLAKRNLFRIPFLGWIMRVSRQIPIAPSDAGSIPESLRALERALEGGERVHVFPEMTRCPAGFVGTRKFVSAPFRAAFVINRPVVPVVIFGTDLIWPKGRAGLSAQKPASVRALEVIDPRGFPDFDALKAYVQNRIDSELAQAAR